MRSAPDYYYALKGFPPSSQGYIKNALFSGDNPEVTSGKTVTIIGFAKLSINLHIKVSCARKKPLKPRYRCFTPYRYGQGLYFKPSQPS